MRNARLLSGVLGLAAVLSACGGLIDPSKNTVDTFAGTLQVGATDSYTYSLSKNGEVTVTLTSVVPPPTNGSIAIALGQVLNGQCGLLSGYLASGIVNRQAAFGLLNKGTYCVVIFDPGVLTLPVAYTGTFSHP